MRPVQASKRPAATKEKPGHKTAGAVARRNTAHLRERARLKILEATTVEFAEQGYFAVTMRQVAGRAGVALGLAYHYFDSKENLLAAAIEYMTDVWIAEVKKWRKNLKFTGLCEFLTEYLLFMRDFIQRRHPHYYRFYQKHIHLDNLPRLAYLEERVSLIQPYIRAEVEAARRRGELNEALSPVLAAFIIETVSGRVQEACYSDFLGMEMALIGCDDATARRRIAAIVAAGLGGVLKQQP